MGFVKMQIAERVDEFARVQPADLRDHQREQRVAGDVERHAEKNIRAALVKLAAQLAVAHVKLKQAMARCQCHLLNIYDIPSADDQAATVGICFDVGNHLCDLVNAMVAMFTSPHCFFELAKVKGYLPRVRINPSHAIPSPLPPLLSIYWS